MLDARGHNLPIGTVCIEDIEIGMARSVSKTIGDRDIELFAELSTDHNPVHLDDAYARDTIFEGRIAHGMLTASLISAVIGEQLPGHGTVYLGQTLKFRAPVRPGDRVEATVAVGRSTTRSGASRLIAPAAWAIGSCSKARRWCWRRAASSTDARAAGPAKGPMKRFHDYRGLAAADRGAAVAMGNFDGVHLGHQSVLALAHAAAAELGAPFGVVTFEPHPRSFFAPDAPPFRLMTADARAHRLEKLGVEMLYELPFGPELAASRPEAFAETVLAGGLGVRHVVVGADFRFGKGRAGDVGTLARLGRALGFGVTVAPLISDAGGGDFSSTAIRAALAEGRPEEAARILGHWHRIEGRVLHGDKRGKALGFPTANLALAGPAPAALRRLRCASSTSSTARTPAAICGAASIGVRPTFGENAPNLEVHLLDFDGDLYGAELSVALVAWLRPELKFDSVEPLVAQMRADVAEARARLART